MTGVYIGWTLCIVILLFCIWPLIYSWWQVAKREMRATGYQAGYNSGVLSVNEIRMCEQDIMPCRVCDEDRESYVGEVKRRPPKAKPRIRLVRPLIDVTGLNDLARKIVLAGPQWECTYSYTHLKGEGDTPIAAYEDFCRKVRYTCLCYPEGRIDCQLGRIARCGDMECH